MIVLTSMNPFEALADAFLADIASVEVLCTYFLIGAIAVIRLERVIENAIGLSIEIEKIFLGSFLFKQNLVNRCSPREIFRQIR